MHNPILFFPRLHSMCNIARTNLV